MTKVTISSGMTFQMHPDSTAHGRCGTEITVEIDDSKTLDEQKSDLEAQVRKSTIVANALVTPVLNIVQNQLVNQLLEFDGAIPGYDGDPNDADAKAQYVQQISHYERT